MALVFAACNTKKPESNPDEEPSQKQYFPVADFLKGQIHHADSLPTAMLKIVTENNRSDSSFIQRDEFNAISQDFILPELEPRTFEKNFKENSFIDATTQSATFNYTSYNSTLSLQRVDVLATTDEIYSKVKSIFMQQSISKNDTIIIKKLFWLTNKRFQIVTSVQPPNQPRKVNALTITWDAGE